MWYVLYRDGSNRLSVHRDEMMAIMAALRLPNEQLQNCVVGPVGGATSEMIGGKNVSELRDEMGARGIDALTPVLLTAFLGALALIVIPGDQTGDALAWLGRAAGFW